MDDSLERFYRQELRRKNDQINFLQSQLWEITHPGMLIMVSKVERKDIPPPQMQEVTGRTPVDSFVKSMLED